MKKITVPVYVAITRYYRADIDATGIDIFNISDRELHESIMQRTREQIVDKQDSVLTPDPDLEIEEQDIRCVSIDYDGIQLD